jgi:hypothetical protein
MSGQTGNQSQSRTVALPQAVLAGSTLLVFATESNGGNAGAAIGITDTLGHSYTKLQQEDDTQSPNWQSVYLYAAYNSSSGSSVSITANFGVLIWQGLVVMEVANVPAAPLIGSVKNLQKNISSTAANLITSTPIAGGTNKAILIGLSMVTGDQNTANGGSGLGRPNVGTGFTKYLEAWNWMGAENTSNAPSAMIAYRNSSSLGSAAVTMTPTGGTDDYVSLAVALKSN